MYNGGGSRESQDATVQGGLNSSKKSLGISDIAIFSTFPSLCTLQSKSYKLYISKQLTNYINTYRDAQSSLPSQQKRHPLSLYYFGGLSRTFKDFRIYLISQKIERERQILLVLVFCKYFPVVHLYLGELNIIEVLLITLE